MKTIIASTKSANDLAEELMNLFVNRENRSLKIDGLDSDNHEHIERIKKTLNYIIPDYQRKIIDYSETDNIIKLTIRSSDPVEYQRSVYDLQNARSKNLETINSMIKNCYFGFVNQSKGVESNLTDINDLRIEQRPKIIIDDLDDRNDVTFDEEHIGMHDWYLSKVSIMTIIKDIKKIIKRKTSEGPNEFISYEKIKNSMIVEKLISSFSNDAFIKILSVDCQNDSIYSLPIIYQNERLGFSGRLAPLHLYHVISDLLDGSRWIIFDNEIISKANHELDPDEIKKYNEKITNCFAHDFFKSYDINKSKIPKIRRYDTSDSFIVELSFGLSKHYFEVVLTDKQKEFLKNGGERDELC